jgi:glycosyltransferase involved in cell wall biosynthesis
VLQYFPYFRLHGIDPQAVRPVPNRLYQRLVERRSGQLGKLAYYSLFASMRALQVRRAAGADMVVIQRDLFPFGPPLLERWLAQRNPHLVYDTDDATYLRPSFTPNTPFQRLRRFDKVAEVVRHARWVSVATEPIAAWARQYNANVSVVPMALDLNAYVPSRRRSATPLVLGWAGTAGGLRYLDKLAPVLRTLGDRAIIRVVSGGFPNVRLSGVPLDARPWRGINDLRDFDVGLLPLDDSQFERAKFPFKLLQYFALGLPVVASRVGIAAEVIKDGENGLLASSEQEWHAALCRLIEDAGLRRKLGEAGRETVRDRYTVERVAPLLVEGLLAAAR